MAAWGREGAGMNMRTAGNSPLTPSLPHSYVPLQNGISAAFIRPSDQFSPFLPILPF